MVCRLQNCGSLRWNSYPISCLKMWFPKVGIVLIQHSPPGQWSKLKKEVKNTGHFKILRISVIFCMQTNYAWANVIAQVFRNDPSDSVTLTNTLTLSGFTMVKVWIGQTLRWSHLSDIGCSPRGSTFGQIVFQKYFVRPPPSPSPPWVGFASKSNGWYLTWSTFECV